MPIPTERKHSVAVSLCILGTNSAQNLQQNLDKGSLCRRGKNIVTAVPPCDSIRPVGQGGSRNHPQGQGTTLSWKALPFVNISYTFSTCLHILLLPLLCFLSGGTVEAIFSRCQILHQLGPQRSCGTEHPSTPNLLYPLCG